MGREKVLVVGGGPAGSVAALCLRHLGREVDVFERARFPRYVIGESLLPGTLAILSRLGLGEAIQKAGFVKKRGATFLWGASRKPWSFSFQTRKTAPWVHDHAYQVNRAEFDQILLDEAGARGARIHCGHEALEVDLSPNGTPLRLEVGDGGGDRRVQGGDFLIDASGSRGFLARRLKLRRHDPYFRNVAIWAYFQGGKRFTGDLEGNVFTLAIPEGWMWLIPLKDDVYSVGVVAGRGSTDILKERGREGFLQSCIEAAPLAREILAGAEQCEPARATKDWAYDTETYAPKGNVFLCGDAACFIDPLFSQGVHLAVYSAMMSAAAIDRMIDHPEEADQVRAWYEGSYGSLYSRYHQFLTAFYCSNAEQGSDFWARRRVEGAEDERFAGRAWFEALGGAALGMSGQGLEGLGDRASRMSELWQHDSRSLDDRFDATELSLRRLKVAGEALKTYKRMAAIEWTRDEVRLESSYRVHPTTFKLEPERRLGDGQGATFTALPLGEAHRELFAELRNRPLGYKALARRLKSMGEGTPLQIVGGLMELGLLRGYDREGNPLEVHHPLRFAGVGAEDEYS